MGKWSTRFTPSARRDLRSIPRPAALRILGKLTDLEADPYGLDTTELVDDPGYRRLRIGPYRAVYTLNSAELVIWVILVAHRSSVYRDLGRRA